MVTNTEANEMADGRIPNVVLYGELISWKRTVGRPYLCYKDTGKHDMKKAGIDINNRETAAIGRGNWSSFIKAGTKRGEDRRRVQLAERNDHRKQTSANAAFSSLQTVYVCHIYGTDCHDRVGFRSDIWRTDTHCVENHYLAIRMDAT